MQVPRWLTQLLWLQDGPWQPQDQALVQLTERNAQQAATLQPGGVPEDWQRRLISGLRNMLQDLKAVCFGTPASGPTWPKLKSN